MLTQLCCTYQKCRAPAQLALTLHAYCAQAKLNHALAHLLQPSQGRLNEPRSAAFGCRGSAGLYSEGACYVMTEALDSEHNLFFYNKL